MHYGMWRAGDQLRHRRVWWGSTLAGYTGPIWAQVFGSVNQAVGTIMYTTYGNYNTE